MREPLKTQEERLHWSEQYELSYYLKDIAISLRILVNSQAPLAEFNEEKGNVETPGQ